VFGAFRYADDFTIPAPANLTSITCFAYMTGSTNAQLFTTGNIRLWRGRPGDVGSTIVFGDTTTDRLSSSALTNIFRIFGSTAAPGGTPSAPGTTRHIKTAVFDTPVFLDAGSYWIDDQITSAVTPTGAVFNPAVTVVGDRTVAGANSRQFVNDPPPPATATGAIWQDSVDTGNPDSLPDVPLAIPFRVEGTLIPEPATGVTLAALAAGILVRRRRIVA
jgi:hypothetical protein